MKRLGALAAVLALFVIGVGVGVLGTHLYYAKQIRRVGGGGALHIQRFSQMLERRLELTADQKRQVAAILEQSRAEGDALHRDMLPIVRRHMEQTAQRIRDVLTPEQQVKFDELQRTHRRRAEAFFLHRGGRRPHGPPRHEWPQPAPPPEPPND